MNVIVIGLGSMGQRRIRLIQAMNANITICGVDAKEERRKCAADKWRIHTYESIHAAATAEKPDAAVISTSPLSHATLIRECLLRGWHVFTELNLVADGYEENTALAEKMGRVLFLSSTFLYRDETRYISTVAQAQSKPLSYRYHVGQYLPDWHPWENYTDYFIGDRRTNGCRELLAIELPWLIGAFGEIERVQVSRRKLTTLKTAYDDSLNMIFSHRNGTLGSLCIDVVSRKAVRKFELIGEDVYLTWDGTPDSVMLYDVTQKKDMPVCLTDNVDRQESYAAFVVENAYANELRAYFDAIQGKSKANYGFAEDLKTLSLIDRIEVEK